MSFEKSVLGMALRATGPRHVEARLQEFLAGFSPLGTAPYSTHLSCTLHAHPSPELIGKMEICQQIGNPLYYYQAMKVYEVPNKTNQRLYGDGTSYLLLDMEAKTLEGYISEQTAGRDFFFEDTLFSFPLFDYLSATGFYLMHAAAVASPGGERVILFPAMSGQGKTSITLSLIRKGYSHVSDDLLFFTPEGRWVDFPRPFHVSTETIASMDELRFLMNRPDRLSRNQKKILKREEIRALYADSEYLNGFHTDQVKSVVFPKIQASERSKMNPLTPGETLERLIPASALIIVNRREAARQLEALRSLVEKATCWEWNLGEDLKGRPEATTSYLETKLDECSLL